VCVCVCVCVCERECSVCVCERAYFQNVFSKAYTRETPVKQRPISGRKINRNTDLHPFHFGTDAQRIHIQDTGAPETALPPDQRNKQKKKKRPTTETHDTQTKETNLSVKTRLCRPTTLSRFIHSRWAQCILNNPLEKMCIRNQHIE